MVSFYPLIERSLEHFYHICQILKDTDRKFLTKLPSYHDIIEVVIADVVAVWNRANLPTTESRSIHTNLSELLKDLQWHVRELHLPDVSEECLYKQYGISKCRFDDKVPAAEVEFLLDQSSTRKMVLSSTPHMIHAKHRKHALSEAKRRKISSSDNPKAFSTSKKELLLIH